MSQEQSGESSPISQQPLQHPLAAPPSVPDSASDPQVEGQSGSDTLYLPASGSPTQSAAAPLQKRRRVTRACDECRKKKIKCDGRQPCTHCQVYTYECTYDQPSNRRRNPDPQHVEVLEARLYRATSLLNRLMPGIDLDDPVLDAQLLPSDASHGDKNVAALTTGQDSMLESMVESTGSLDLDDDGYWDFYGHSSGRAFLRRMRSQFGQIVGISDQYAYAMPPPKDRVDHRPSDSPVSTQSIADARTLNLQDLPTKECAQVLCEGALGDACAVLKFVHHPSFYAMLDRVYEQSPQSRDHEAQRFLPLLYAALAVGALFSTAEQSELMTSGFEDAIEQGSHWYKIARSLIDVTDIRDITSLQTLLFMVMFLQSSANLSNCYAHIGICLSSALRMGLHRSINHNDFNPIIKETRKRIFWCIIKLDIYVGALLGLPRMLRNEDIDQEQPLEVDDECITSTKILPMPVGKLSLMAGFNAHTRIVDVLSKVVKYIYPLKSTKSAKGAHTYIVNHARIREIEHDLQEWMEGLPEPLKPGEDTPRQFIRVQHILRMAYAHIEMFLYRPFLHYASRGLSSNKIDKRSYACAAACVSVSRNIVHLTEEMKKRGLLVGSYWFYMYSTFFAIIALLFYVLENPSSSTSHEILKDAYEGKDTLARLSSKSLAADRCTKYLTDLFNQVSIKLKEVPKDPPAIKREHHSQVSSGASGSSAQKSKASNVLLVRNVSPNQRGGWHQSSHAMHQVENSGEQPFTHSTRSSFIQPRASATPQSPASWMSTPPGHEVNDLGAMMFPSSDPFAYPTQPMITLENRQQFGSRNDVTQQPFFPTTTAGMVPQVFSPGIPDYGQMPQGQTPDQFLRTETDLFPSSTIPLQQGDPWPHQRQGPFQPPPGGNYDQLFGEDWSGWMPHGGRQ